MVRMNQLRKLKLKTVFKKKKKMRMIMISIMSIKKTMMNMGSEKTKEMRITMKNIKMKIMRNKTKITGFIISTAGIVFHNSLGILTLGSYQMKN